MIKTITKKYSKLNNQPIGYEVIYNNSNIQLFVPLDPANTDYQEIQKWIADGNTVIDNGGNN